jgi:hypothetical protein
MSGSDGFPQAVAVWLGLAFAGRCRCSWHSRSAGCRGREKEVSAPVTAIFYDLRHSSGNLAKVTQCAAPR